VPKADQWSDPITIHGEGPIWNPLIQRFQLVDMLEGDVLTVDEGTVTDRTHVDTVAAIIRPRLYGGLVVAGERDVILIDIDGAQHRIEGSGVGIGSRFNEGACAPDGSLWAGTMAYDAAAGAGVMVRLDPGTLSFTQVAADLTISNGLAFEDTQSAYFVDSASRSIDRLRIYSGEITGRSLWVDLANVEGVPDGICRDENGGVWVALYDGGAVHRYSAAGDLTDIVTVPVGQVTACALGGADGRQLLITTSQLGHEGQVGAGGALFQISVDIPGTYYPLFGA